MRTFVSAIAVVVGVLLSALAVPAIWLDRNVVQEDGFVALAAPLGQDAEFQQRLAAAAVGTIDTGAIPDALADLVTPVLEAAASSLTALPGYPAAWEETLRKSHRLSFAAPASAPAEPDSPSSLTLDVAPLVALATKELARTTGLPLTAPEQTLVNVGEPEQRQMVERASAYAPLGYSLAIGAGIAFALALVSARRRWTVILAVGLGALALGGLWAAGSQVARDAVVGTASGNGLSDMFKDAFVAAASSSFQSWVGGAAITGAVLVAAAVVIRIASPGRRAPTR
ncbi:hypothetical protein NG697_11075 [Pseudarthrobacter sp. MDT3-26]|uniref:hypothetical protein n=1 Tax=Pseudarthrobacter raffinosi TaxID=2953651 RepID=UPI00208FE736|nr:MULTISPECIES: hypothetical protein [unclassified Pseudarthrobacter]MCO4235953.1 hypothetical protein [Pseudarthrobacter sp. MDT3-28]MCO4263455.1 hypothetical protein [Pseudarthrobacter sp. MDT3-26]